MTTNIPKGYNQVMPYLIIEHPEKFLEFTKIVFNAEEKMKQMRDEHTIMHGEIMIGDNCIMFAQATEQFQPMTAGLFVFVEDADESYNKAIAAGGTTVMELSDQDYGRTCGVMDPSENTWWITSVK